MAERIFDIDQMPLGSFWDLSSIRRTQNCDGCKYLVEAKRNSEKIEICDWGVALKILEPGEKLASCQKIGRKPPSMSSSYRINKIK